MDDVMLKDLLGFLGTNTEITLSHREGAGQEWGKSIGKRADEQILRWMNCVVIACKWERDQPIQIAVEGVPYETRNSGTN